MLEVWSVKEVRGVKSVRSVKLTHAGSASGETESQSWS